MFGRGRAKKTEKRVKQNEGDGPAGREREGEQDRPHPPSVNRSARENEAVIMIVRNRPPAAMKKLRSRSTASLAAVLHGAVVPKCRCPKLVDALPKILKRQRPSHCKHHRKLTYETFYQRNSARVQLTGRQFGTLHGRKECALLVRSRICKRIVQVCLNRGKGVCHSAC